MSVYHSKIQVLKPSHEVIRPWLPIFQKVSTSWILNFSDDNPLIFGRLTTATRSAPVIGLQRESRGASRITAHRFVAPRARVALKHRTNVIPAEPLGCRGKERERNARRAKLCPRRGGTNLLTRKQITKVSVWILPGLCVSARMLPRRLTAATE